MPNIFPIDFEEKNSIANDDFILFSDSEDGNKLKKAQYSNLKGEQGDPGTPGADGAAATITVGTVTTGAPGSSATVTNSGTSSAAVLNFSIPQGATGTPGADGSDGADGAAATITVGTTTTLSPGSSATVTNVGTSSAAVLNFGIPQGTPGTGSGDVSGPASSTDGHLAVFDGVSGKQIKDGGVIPTVPTKTSDLDNDSGFIAASDFETSTTVGATLTISYFTTQITPSANFTLIAGTVKEGMQYIVRVNSGATAYTMSLGTGVTNPFGEDLTLTVSKTTTVVLLATSSSTLEIFSIRTAE